jgi:hypothetical protein
MALTERQYTKWSKDNELCCIGVKLITVVERDGVVISELVHRKVINPGDDYSNEDAEVVAICDLYHTPAVIDTYKAFVATQELIGV